MLIDEYLPHYDVSERHHTHAAAGNVATPPVWHLVTRTQTMFRAEPLTSVGAEVVVP